MLALSLAAFAGEQPAEELLDFIGMSKDHHFLVIDVRSDIHSQNQSAGELRLRIAIDTSSQERKEWLLSSKPNPNNDKGEDPELWTQWEALLALPKVKDYESWAKSVAITPLVLNERCNDARRYAEIIQSNPDVEAPKGSWKGAHYNVNGTGHLVYGVERYDHLWEHGSQVREGRDRSFWAGGTELTMAWSADCSRIIWVVRDTTPKISRDGYDASYENGTITSIQIEPAGPQIAVVADETGEIAGALDKAGVWAKPTTLSLPAASTPTIYTWSAAQAAAKVIAASLPGATIAPLPQPTSIDVVVVPARK